MISISYSTIYLIQVATGKEETYICHVKNLTGSKPGFQLIVPKRQLTIRKLGREKQVVKPIFPGYIFLISDCIEPEARALLRSIPGFMRYMRDENGDLIPLSNNDRQLLIQLTSTGETTKKSIVSFDKNNKVVPLSGFLKDCEGKIIKVDRRKRRVKVKFLLNDKTFLIDFEYEEVIKRKENPDR
jgi:transcription termination/antitermination protein NusG